MTNSRDDSGMERRTVLQTLGAGAVGASGLIAAGGSATADDSPDHYHNPVGPLGFGDVSIIDDGNGTYYAYGTETPQDIMPIAESTDMANWEYVGQVLDETPDWHPTEPDPGCWAPDVRYHNGQYHVYYSLSVWGSENAGIGLATSDSPTGPFTDQGPVIESDDLDLTNCIDADTVIVNGQPWLIWGSWNGIYAVQMNDVMDDIVPGTEFHMAGDMIEGAVMLQDNGYYYLIYSTGQCCEGYDSTYRLEVGRSENFEGPYYNQEGMDLRDITDHHQGVPILEGDSYFTGPGHNDVYRGPNGNWWCFYHTEAHEEDEERYMMLDRIQFDANDWPVIACTGTPSAQAPMPLDTFDCSEVEHHDDGGSGGAIANGTYRVTNVNSGKFLEVGSADTSDGANVNQWADTGHACQEWYVEDQGGGEYTFENVNSGQLMEVESADTSDGANVQQWPANGHATQRWYVEDTGGGEYRLVNVNSGLVADVEGGSTDDGANVLQWTDNGGANQRWYFDPA